MVVVQRVHEKKILHGDLKPDNIMFDGPDLYLIDFGVAKEIDKIKKSDKLQGSAEFTSPLKSFDDKRLIGKKDEAIAVMYIALFLDKCLVWLLRKLKFLGEILALQKDLNDKVIYIQLINLNKLRTCIFL